MRYTGITRSILALAALCSVCAAVAIAAQVPTVTLPSGEAWVADELIVKLDRPIEPTLSRAGTILTGIAPVDAVSAEVGAIGIRPFFFQPPTDEALADEVGLDNLWIVTLAEGQNVFMAADAYNRCPGVVQATPNGVVTVAFTPDDPYFGSRQWGPQKIECPGAWDIGRGSNDVVIAINDTGIDYNHPDLAAKIQLPGYNAFTGGSDAMDDYGHGTHVAGIAAAVTDNSVGIAGVCIDCKILPVKVLDSGGSGTWDSVANGVVWAADNGAHVINQSLGGGSGSATLESAMNYAFGRNVVLVCAAGNNGSTYPFYPAYYDVAIAVAASDPDDNRASFSNYGTWVDVAAPGASVYSTMPTYFVTLNYYGYAMNYEYLDGTSMASPHVAGLAGLLLGQLGVGASNTEVRRLIEEYSDNVPYAYWGRINTLNSMAAAGGAVPETVLASKYAIWKGTRVSGNVASLKQSDDNRLVVTSVLYNNLHRCNYVVKGTTTVLHPSKVEMTWEGQMDRWLKLNLFMYDYTISRFVKVYFDTVGPSDKTITVVQDGPDAWKYVNPVNGEVKIRTERSVVATKTITISTDMVRWTITP